MEKTGETREARLNQVVKELGIRQEGHFQLSIEFRYRQFIDRIEFEEASTKEKVEMLHFMVDRIRLAFNQKLEETSRSLAKV